MIVGTYYEGDDDMEVAWKQHDVYDQGVRTIIDSCNSLARFAKMLLDDKSHDEWGTIERIDHRTIQPAHDLLAAAWRFRHDLRQSELRLERQPDTLVPPTHENLWLRWLRAEIESWVWSPSLVRYVQLILTNQNQPIGYTAESKLALALIERFSEVPWTSGWRDAFEKNQENDLRKFAKPEAEPMRGLKIPIVMPCGCTAKGLSACNRIPCETEVILASREGWGLLE
ncbi:hypothetical protein [Hwanghaeella sp. LZ110]|uniref:hypothetical protein n=1 Tax=Hwanghaeella sp. LZ110 TaxID=3402810 RepID=UPI003B6757CC